MQQPQMQIKRRVEANWLPQNGGEDDGRMAENHGKHKADKHSVQSCIVNGPGNQPASLKEDCAA